MNEKPVRVPCQLAGWKFAMELRWAGGDMKVTRYFVWDELKLPMFCKMPG
jgi:hypothetical protein